MIAEPVGTRRTVKFINKTTATTKKPQCANLPSYFPRQNPDDNVELTCKRAIRSKTWIFSGEKATQFWQKTGKSENPGTEEASERKQSTTGCEITHIRRSTIDKVDNREIQTDESEVVQNAPQPTLKFNPDEKTRIINCSRVRK
ncbi:hypothetical protein RUM43_012491 [Polyplax serrata]|uniref:Uncharacterized protein n=1 Tax=Polyplax serrata TaxID=468196 RepID=A0AAN8NSC6_POLSC